MKTLILSEEYVRENTIINQNLDFTLIRPYIFAVQDFKLKPLLGSDLYNLILEQCSTVPDTLTTANRTLVDDYILNILAWYLTSELLIGGKFRITNAGIQENSTDHSQPIATSDLIMLENRYNNYAQPYAQDMVNYILAHLSDYPTYSTNNTIDKTKPNRSAYNIALHLPDDCN